MNVSVFTEDIGRSGYPCKGEGQAVRIFKVGYLELGNDYIRGSYAKDIRLLEFFEQRIRQAGDLNVRQ